MVHVVGVMGTGSQVTTGLGADLPTRDLGAFDKNDPLHGVQRSYLMTVCKLSSSIQI